MATKFTRAFWGKSREGFTPSPGGLRSWYNRYGRSFPDLQLVDTGEEPYLKFGDSLIDVIAGTSGNARWGWKTVGEPDAKSAEEKAKEVEEEQQRLAQQAAGEQEWRDWDTQASDSGDMMDPSAAPWFDPVYTTDPRNQGQRLRSDDPLVRDEYAPPNTRYDPDTGKLIVLSPGSEGYKETWGGYYETGDPCTWKKENREQRYQALKSTYKEQGWKTPENWPTSLAECPEKPPCEGGQERDAEGNCPPPPPPPGGECDDQPGTVWDEALGRCVYPPPGPGDPTPGYRTYGMDPNNPNQPWEVDLSYLKDAPPFEFEHDPWVEPDPFAYAAYDQPEAFSYPEFSPPTGQQVLDEDPGYQFRREEGRKALEREIAARGTRLTGATKKALHDYGADYASQEYQKAFNRRLQQYREGAGLAERSYDRNVGLGQWAHATNLGAARDQWTLGRGSQLEGYGVNRQNAYQLARDQYAPQLASWTAEQRAKERAALEKFGRQWQAYTYGQPSASTIYQTGAGYSTT